jgi:hypothetical protein
MQASTAIDSVIAMREYTDPLPGNIMDSRSDLLRESVFYAVWPSLCQLSEQKPHTPLSADDQYPERGVIGFVS